MKNTNEFINEVKIYDIEGLQSHYEAKTKGHWFSPGNMRFFKSRLSENLFYNPENRVIYFISSEKYWSDDRAYTIRSYNPDTGEIDTYGEFQAYSSLAKAKNAAKRLVT
jgi:hypothetical protein